MFRPSDGVLQTATACFPTSKLRILENWIAVTFTSFRQRQLALSGVGAFVELHAYVDPSTQVMLEKSSVFDGIGLYFTSISRWLSLNYHLVLYTSRTLGTGLSRPPCRYRPTPLRAIAAASARWATPTGSTAPVVSCSGRVARWLW